MKRLLYVFVLIGGVAALFLFAVHQSTSRPVSSTQEMPVPRSADQQLSEVVVVEDVPETPAGRSPVLETDGAGASERARRKKQSVALVVVERDTGLAVENYAIRVWRRGRTYRPALSHAYAHSRGELDVETTLTGPIMVQVVPLREDLVPSIEEEIPAPTSEHQRHRVELEPAAELGLRVLFPDGSPVAGTTVELVDPTTYPYPLRLYTPVINDREVFTLGPRPDTTSVRRFRNLCG